jgi:Copper type II ascorbate-dependent monooxygenase, C-terminal domain
MKLQDVAGYVAAVAFGALAALSVGCGGGSATPTGTSTVTPPVTGPTYYRDVKPLMDVKCGGCHVDKGIAPFPLTTYEQAFAQREAVAGAVTQGLMPPWPPSDSCTTYTGDRSLSQAQIDTLTQWVSAGAPEGSLDETPVAVTDTSLHLSRIDETIQMAEPYTPQIRPDDYRCFLIDWPVADTTYITGVGVEPGTPAIVHHVIAFLALPDVLADYEAMNGADGKPGWTCFGGPGGGSQESQAQGWVTAWAPGTLGADFPAGTGIQVPQGSKIVIQVHYNTSTTAPEPDQTKLLFKIDPSVEKQAVMMPWADPGWLSGGMDIPAHSADTEHSFAYDPTSFLGFLSNGAIEANKSFTIYSAGLHMHLHGTHAITQINRAGGDTDCLLDIQDWNFHWQGGYGFTETKTFNPGDKLSLECHWDNMGPTDLNWGESTGDEMCLGVYYATQ